MNHLPAVIFWLSLLTAHAAELRDALNQSLAKDLTHLQDLYTHLHSNPELSHLEEKTAARIAKELRDVGYEVTEKVGGHGVVGVFKNGDGPVVLVRTDLDALP